MDPIIRKAKNYRNVAGKSPFRDWIRREVDGAVRNRVNTRIRRIEVFGNYGDCEPVGHGVYELRIHLGPGYRVYFGIDGDEIILPWVGEARAPRILTS